MSIGYSGGEVIITGYDIGKISFTGLDVFVLNALDVCSKFVMILLGILMISSSREVI